MILLAFSGCTDEREEVVDSFITHIKNLEIDEAKKYTTDDTDFLLSVSIEPVIKLGTQEDVGELQKVLETVTYVKEEDKWICSFENNTGVTETIDLQVIDDNGRLLIDIDKSFFLGE